MNTYLHLDLFCNEAQITEQLQIYGAAGKKALTRTIRKFIRMLAMQAKKEMALANKLPQKLFKKRIHVYVSFNELHYSNIWIGLNPFSYSRVGAVKQLKRGVRAGKHFAPGAFVWRGRAFRRRGKARLPIDQIQINIEDKSQQVLKKIQKSAVSGNMVSAFKKIFQQELSYAINHEKS